MTTTSGPVNLAALDIGTNSFHLVVARLLDNGYDIVTREKETVRLGHGGGDMKELSADAIDRGISSLRRMQRIAASHDAKVRAVATSAVREAANADVFLTRARREAKIDVEVISGLEESRLIHLGVLQAVPVFDQRIILVDIGGGSTEVLVGERGETLAARSFKLGAVRLTDRFFPGGTTSNESVRDCRSYARSILATFEREVEDFGFDVAIASSGTAETIARMVHAARDDTPLHTFNRFEFTVNELQSVIESLLKKKTSDDRRGVPGLDPARADIIVAGALVLESVADIFGIKRFVFSEAALREGVLLDTIARLQGGALHHLRDVSRNSIRALAERCDDDLTHSAHVATLALQLFDSTEPQHGLPTEAREYLEAGALLANVGLVISHSKHHLHSYYVVRNSELTGLTDAEIEIIAQIARYHRKSAPKASHAEFGRLSPEDQRLVKTLAGILRVAIGLDRSHDGRVRSVMAQMRNDRLVVEAVAKRGKEISLELYTANERSDLLEEVLGKRVGIVAAPLPTA
ncbi:MAG: Ppx/GppA family phosphatase [Ilumatobacteraceae bacterium]|nr:Ppx/GppA family phosphatase [Ilumatobacteraceae bacterium]